MAAVGTFFQEHYKVMLIGLAGVILGVLLNNWVRDIENKRFLKTLVDEKNKLDLKSQNGTLANGEIKLIDKLDTEIYIMKFKCNA